MIDEMLERGTFVHKGHSVRFTMLEDKTVKVIEKFGDTQAIPKRLDMSEAIVYQDQLKEIGYGKED